MKTATVRVSGLRELEAELAKLKKSVGMSVLRRVGKGALTPMMEDAKSKAPEKTGTLVQSIVIKNTPDKVYKAAARDSFLKFGHAKGVKRDKSTGISLSLAPTARRGTNLWRYAFYQEYGTIHMSAQPYMRPAWDSGKENALEYIEQNLSKEISNSVAKAERKAARARSKA